MRAAVDATVAVAGTLGALALPTESVVEIAAKYGAAGAAVGWFMWRDWKREKEMNRLLDKRHAELAEIARDSTAAIERMAGVAEKCKGKP